MPQLWTALHEPLPNRQRVGGRWDPALPLILAAWNDTAAISKMLILEEHIGWAIEHSALEAVGVFIRYLEETDWLHLTQ